MLSSLHDTNVFLGIDATRKFIHTTRTTNFSRCPGGPPPLNIYPFIPGETFSLFSPLKVMKLYFSCDFSKVLFFSLALSGRWRSRSFGISYTTGILKTDGMLLYAPQRLAIILWMNRERRVALGEVSEVGVRMTRGKLPMIECTSGFPDSACFMYSEFSFYVAARL